MPPLEPQTLATGGWQAIIDGNGLGVAVTGMLIVFTALTLITLFIAALPKMLHAMGPYLPELATHTEPLSDAERLLADEEQVIAAIGFVLHTESQRASRR